MNLKQNTIINLAGSVLTLIVAVIAVPLNLSLIGSGRYGALAIVWVLLGYFGLFELGTGRAIANQIAKLRGGSQQEIEQSFWTALLMNAGFGVLGGVTLLLLGNILLGSLFKIPPELRVEALSALPIIALSVPVVTISAVLCGALEGKEHFLTTNLSLVAVTISSQLAPIAVTYWKGPDLRWLVGAVLLIRTVTVIVTFLICIKLVPITKWPRFDISRVGSFFQYGGWITLSGLINPYLLRLDLFTIGARLGIQVVPQYSIPYNLVIQILVLPISLSNALFPRFSSLRDEEVRSMGRNSFLSLAAIITPGIVLCLVVLKPLLSLWVGPYLTNVSAPVGQILLLGIWFNSLAIIPFTLLQSRGRPDLTAKFHFIELGPYLLALWLGLTIAGLPGAACAWVFRVILDAVLLYRAAGIPWKHLIPLAYSAILVVLATISSLTLFAQLSGRLVIGGALVLISLVVAWYLAPLDLKLVFRRFPYIRAEGKYRGVSPSDGLFK